MTEVPVPRPRNIKRPRAQATITGPYSRVLERGALGSINGCSREGRYLRDCEHRLTEHVGGNPTIVQKVLITRASRLMLHLQLLDEKTLKDAHIFGVHDHNFYIAWSNSLTRILGRLGLESRTADRLPTLAEAMAEARREREGTEAA